MDEVDGLPAALRRYVILVGVGGPLLSLLVAAIDRPGLASLDPRQAIWVGLLLVLATVAERFPLQLTYRTVVNVATAAYAAMLVTLPPAWPGLLALCAAAVAHLDRLRTEPDRRDRYETAFNIGQSSASVTVGAIAFWFVNELAWFASFGAAEIVGTVAAAAAVMHLANTGLVAMAAGLQTGTSAARIWWTSISLDLPAHAMMVAVGAATAVMAWDRPVLIVFLAAPLILVRRTVAQSVQLRRDTHEAISALVEVVELRDPYTAGHSRRVATIARVVSRRLGLTEAEAEDLESAGRVHDVGKVAVDPAILIKQSRLADDEWAQMRLHPVHGADVLARFAAYADGVPLVRHHHEAWDGTGYPDGLVGEAIPLGARILAVADTFDALTSDRPYRAGMPVEKAIGILQDGAGKQWDPRIVDAMVGVLRENPDSIPIYGKSHQPSSSPQQNDAPPPIHVPAAPGFTAGLPIAVQP